MHTDSQHTKEGNINFYKVNIFVTGQKSGVLGIIILYFQRSLSFQSTFILVISFDPENNTVLWKGKSFYWRGEEYPG